MITPNRILKIVTVLTYAAALVVAYMDLFIWRP
jgi:hypothetical protein